MQTSAQRQKKMRSSRRRRLLNFLGSRCVRCFSYENLEVHHKVQKLRGAYHVCNNTIAWQDYQKAKDSLVLYCHSCHTNMTKIEYKRDE